MDSVLLDMGTFFFVLWRPAAALSRTFNGIQDCGFTRSGICFYWAGTGGPQHVPPGLPIVFRP